MASVELYMPGGSPQVLDYWQHDTPGSFKAGDLVTVDSSGRVKIASAAITFLGVARIDADTTDTNLKIPVELIDPHAVYSVRMADSTTGDTCATASDTIIGEGVGIVSYTAGAFQFTDTLEDSAYIVGRDPRDTDGTQGGRVLIRFLGTALTKQY